MIDQRHTLRQSQGVIDEASRTAEPRRQAAGAQQQPVGRHEAAPAAGLRAGGRRARAGAGRAHLRPGRGDPARAVGPVAGDHRLLFLSSPSKACVI